MSIAERGKKAVVVYYVADPEKRDFPITFQFLDEEKNIGVYLRKSSDNSLKKLVYLTEYFVETNEDGANNIWGTITIRKDTTIEIEPGDKIAIEREIPVNQESTFSAQTVFSSTMDYAIDKLTAIVQDMQFMNNTLHIPVDEDADETTLNIGTSTDRANKLVGFDSFGNATLVASGGDGSERCLRIPLDEGPIPDLVMYKELRKGKAPYFDKDGSLQFLDAASLIGIEVIIKDTIGKVNDAVDKATKAETTATRAETAATKAEKTATKAETTAGEAKTATDKINKELPELRYTAGDNICIKHDWTVNKTNSEPLWGITCGEDSQRGDLYAAVGKNGTIVTSNDGSSWSSKGSSQSNEIFNEVECANGKFIAVGSITSAAGNAQGLMYVSDNGGETWNRFIPSGSALAATTSLYEIKYVNNQFIAVGENSVMLTSRDGAEWKQITGIPSNKTLHGIAYGNGMYIIPTYESNILIGTQEAEGKWTWVPTKIPDIYRLFDAEYGNGIYTVVGSNQNGTKGVILTSEKPNKESSSWKRKDIEGISAIYGVVYKSGQFIATGDEGVILISSDGELWSKEAIDDHGKLWGAASNGRSIVAVSDNGKIYKAGAQNVISAVDTKYTLQIASKSVLGGVKEGANITIDGYGVISAQSEIVAYKVCDVVIPSKEWGYAFYGAFTKPTELSEARHYLVAATVGDYVLFGGGYGSSNVVDIFKLNWDGTFTKTTGTELSEARNDLAAATVGDYVLFGGGFGNNGVSKVVDIFKLNDDGTFTQITGTTLSAARYGLAAATVGNYVLFGGGFNDNGASKVVDIFKLNGDGTFTQTTDTTLSEARHYLAAATVGDYVLFGGGGYYDTVDIFRLNDDGTFTKTKTTLSAGRSSLAAATVGDYVLFGGGRNSRTGFSKVVDIFKLNGDGTFTKTTGTELSEARYDLAAATVGDYVLFGGGYSDAGASKVVDIFKLNGDGTFTQTTDTTLSEARYSLAAATVGNYVLFGGGSSDNSSSKVVDIFKRSKYFTAEICAPKINEGDVAISDIKLNDDIAKAQLELEEWKKVSRIATMNKAIKADCFEEAPTIDLKIQLKV